MKIKFALVWLCICSLLSGCAATGPLFVEEALSSPENALIYVYRSDENVGEVVDIPHIYINDKRIASIRSGGYTVYEVEPGPVNLKVKDALFGLPSFTHFSVDFVAEAGKELFLFMTWVNGYQAIMGVDKETALQEIKTYKLQPAAE